MRIRSVDIVSSRFCGDRLEERSFCNSGLLRDNQTLAWSLACGKPNPPETFAKRRKNKQTIGAVARAAGCTRKIVGALGLLFNAQWTEFRSLAGLLLVNWPQF